MCIDHRPLCSRPHLSRPSSRPPDLTTLLLTLHSGEIYLLMKALSCTDGVEIASAKKKKKKNLDAGNEEGG